MAVEQSGGHSNSQRGPGQTLNSLVLESPGSVYSLKVTSDLGAHGQLTQSYGMDQERETGRLTKREGEKGRETNKTIERISLRETDRQTERHTERHTDRQTDRQTEKERREEE